MRGQRGAHRRCSLPRTGWDLRPPARRTPLESPPRWTPPAATPATRAAGPWAQSAWRLGQHSDRGSGCQMARLQLPACSTRRRRAAFTASQHRYVSMIRRSSTPGCGWFQSRRRNECCRNRWVLCASTSCTQRLFSRHRSDTAPFAFCGLVFKRALTVGLALFMASRPAFLQHLQRSIASGAPSAFRRRAGNQHPSRSIASIVPPTSTRRVPSRVGCPNQHLYSRSIAVCPNPHPSRSIASGVPSTSTCTRVPSRCALTRTRRVPSRAVCPQPALVAFHRERCALNQHCPFRGLVQRALTLPSDMLHALSAGHSLQGVLLVPFRHCPFCRLPLLRSTFSSSKNEPCFAFC